MSAITLIFPHQVFRKHPAIDRQRVVWLTEDNIESLSTDADIRQLVKTAAATGVTSIHVADVADDWLGRRLELAARQCCIVLHINHLVSNACLSERHRRRRSFF